MAIITSSLYVLSKTVDDFSDIILLYFLRSSKKVNFYNPAYFDKDIGYGSILVVPHPPPLKLILFIINILLITIISNL